MMPTPQAFAEVIQSSLKTATALCWDTGNIPPFGSIIQITYGPITSYGIITNIETSSSDDSRTPFAFKQTLEALHKNQPQIFAFIQTTCTIVLTWHSQESSQASSLPVPYPAPLHAWAQRAPVAMSVEALTNQELLESIIESLEPTTCDDALIAIATHAYENHAISSEQLHGFIEKYSQEINNDFRRARRFLQHMERFLTNKRKSS